jgi:hypothetical protein
MSGLAALEQVSYHQAQLVYDRPRDLRSLLRKGRLAVPALRRDVERARTSRAGRAARPRGALNPKRRALLAKESWMSPVPRFLVRWLLAASAGVALFGALLVAAPALTRQGFSLLVYAAPSALDAMGDEPARYASLAHAVMGSLMIGWGTCLFLVTRELLSKGEPLGFRLVLVSLAAWFVPDTTYSILSGYWQNAVLNLASLGLFAVPLLGVHRHLRRDG